MYRLLSGNTAKNIVIAKAGEDMTRGMAVTFDYADDTIKKATAAGEVFLVDVPRNYDGINSMITPTDKDFEVVKSGDTVLAVPTYLGEEYAITEVTATGLVKGDYLKAEDGKFVKGTAGDVCVWVYGGTYSDPTGLAMHIVKRTPANTITA